MSAIKILAMDVDGTLTDGKINVSESGELFKSFDVKDGYAIKHLLSKKNIIPVIVTGRKSKIVENRCKEIGIQHIFQNIEDKMNVMIMLQKKFKVNSEEIAFIGDDLNDLLAMQYVGLAMCPANAVDEIKKNCKYISSRNGGDGAVRDCIEWVVGTHDYD